MSALTHVLSSALFRTALFPIALSLTHGFMRSHVGERRRWAFALGTLFLLAAVPLGARTIDALAHPPAWDFQCFWLYGLVAAHGGNVYDPLAYRAYASLVDSSPAFQREVLAVGFPYPPATIALVMPLGFFTNVHAALAAWFAVQFLGLAAAVIVIARTRAFAMPVLAVATLAFLLPQSAVTVAYAQTNFLALAFVAGAMQTTRRVREGTAIALAVVVKPFAVALLLPALVRARFGVVVTALSVYFSITLVAAVLAAPRTLETFIFAGPVHREPAWMYSEAANQSLWAAALRLASHLKQPLLITGVAVFTVLLALGMLLGTTLLCRRLVGRDQPLALSLALVCGLALYPASSMFYAVLLLVPLIVIFRSPEIGGVPLRITVVTVLSTLTSIGHEQFVSAAYLAAWGFLARITLRRISKTAAVRSGTLVDESELALSYGRSGVFRPISGASSDP